VKPRESGTPGPALLATKLHSPRPRRGTVHRPRLTELFEQELPVLTLLSAPAGFGKTTLLAGLIAGYADDGHQTAWLSLDATDNDLSLFCSYVVAAVQTAAPAVGETALQQLNAAQPMSSVMSSLLNDLADLEGELMLVLDDYHVIETADVHEAVVFIVDHAPPQLHLVIASRADPPLPLARLRARGDLLEIRAADLRFTAAEAEVYFNETVGLHLTPMDVAALESRTEGWIAALQLAALSMQGRDDPTAFIEDFAGDDRFVVDYLAEEVLERQPEDVRQFLLLTSVLDRFTSALCDTVTDDTEGKAMLERLDRANLFLVALDDRRVWYRYHHLFADVLRARLLDEHPDLIPTLHRRASGWYEANDEVTEAITHAMAGADFERAAQLVELAAPALRRRRQESTLRRWLEALPEDIYADRPVLAITLVGARMATGDTTGVESLLRQVESTLDQITPPPIVYDDDEYAGLPVQVKIYRAALALLGGDLDATIAHATSALDLVEPTDHLRRGSAAALLALAHWTEGDLATAEQRYSEAVRELIAADHLADMLGCSLALADIQIAQGRLSDAARTFEAGLRMTTEHPGLRGAADMHVGLSEVLIERNDLDAAARHLELSSELGDPAGLPQHAYRWRVTMASLLRARGDLEGALALLDEATSLYDTDFSPPVRPVTAIRTRVQLQLGDLDTANAWVAEVGLTIADELTYLREYEHITLARVLIARGTTGDERVSGELDDALGLLSRLQVDAERGSRRGSAIEILVLQAAAEHARGDLPAAQTALAEALRRAEPEGYIRLFLHAGADMTELLRTVATRTNDAAPHAKRVLAAAEPDAATPTPRSASPAAPLVDELSARELEVLRLLRSDLSGPDIARELVVSLNTVRTHTKNIYQKLGVNNRREAVTRARELGL
jgi:LuxR family maltose regulon positive regulatory protein